MTDTKLAAAKLDLGHHHLSERVGRMRRLAAAAVLALAATSLTATPAQASPAATDKGGTTQTLNRTENYTGETERFPDTSGPRIAFKTTAEADVTINTRLNRFDQCSAHGGTILVEFELWEFDYFTTDEHIGNDKTINACNYPAQAKWVDVNGGNELYIKATMPSTQCGNCTDGDFIYHWVGDPNDPFEMDSPEKAQAAEVDKVGCIRHGEFDNVGPNMTMGHVHNDLFDGYNGYQWTGGWYNAGYNYRWYAYNQCGGFYCDAIIQFRQNAIEIGALWKVRPDMVGYEWNGKPHGSKRGC